MIQQDTTQLREILFTLDNLEELLNLHNGKYLLFKDNVIDDLLCIENIYDDGSISNYNISACCGSDEIYSFKDYMKYLSTKSKYILVPTSDFVLQI